MTPDDLPDERALVPYEASRFDAKKVLVLAPHPDDEVFGCGGALADLASRGASIDVLLVTDGAAGAADEAGRPAIAARRAAESRAALALLGGGTVHEGGLPDRGLGARADELERLVAARLAAAPDLVFAPSPVETHPDHRAVAYALLAVARRDKRDPGASALRNARVAFYEVSQPFRPNVLVDITPFLERKRNAVRAFVSQEAERDYSSFVDGLNTYRRMTLPSAVRAAEAYAVFPGALLRDPRAVLAALQPRGPEGVMGLRERLAVLFSGRLS